MVPPATFNHPPSQATLLRVQAGRRIWRPVQVPCQGFRMFRLPGRMRLPTPCRTRPGAAPGRCTPHSGGEPRDLEKLVGQVELQSFAIRIRDRIEQRMRSRLLARELRAQFVEQRLVGDRERNRGAGAPRP